MPENRTIFDPEYQRAQDLAEDVGRVVAKLYGLGLSREETTSQNTPITVRSGVNDARVEWTRDPEAGTRMMIVNFSTVGKPTLEIEYTISTMDNGLVRSVAGEQIGSIKPSDGRIIIRTFDRITGNKGVTVTLFQRGDGWDYFPEGTETWRRVEGKTRTDPQLLMRLYDKAGGNFASIATPVLGKSKRQLKKYLPEFEKAVAA